jgi:hypothetical protein
MFPGMRLKGAKVACVIALACAITAAGASANTHTPTGSQIRAAVAKAKRSKQLWSTVNVCNTKRHRDTVGLRGSMPSLGFASFLYMHFQVNYWHFAAKKFEPDPGVTQTVALGDPANQVVQGGALFKFKPPAVVDGTVTFEWKLHGKVIGSKHRATGGGHGNAEYSDPPGYSSNDCFMLH